MNEELFIKRCFDLAKQGVYGVAPAPPAGAILLYNNNIIGEGHNACFDGNFSKVHALKSIVTTTQAHVGESTLFVSLDPFLNKKKMSENIRFIGESGIKKVIYANEATLSTDYSNSKEMLEESGLSVKINPMPEIGQELIKFYKTWELQQRPYIILKYAISADGFIGKNDKQLWLSNNIAKVISHKWRSEVSAILVGTNTASTDNPSLNTRLYPGNDPIRIVIDRHLRLTPDLHLFNQKQMTWVFTGQQVVESNENLQYFHVKNDQQYIAAICNEMYIRQKGILLVEGGAQLLQNCIDTGYWDEVRLFKTPIILREGIKGPNFTGTLKRQLKLKDNLLEQWVRTEKTKVK